jgi:hypothetical protein
MIALLISFLLQIGVLVSPQSYEDLSTAEQQEYMDIYQSQIITEDIYAM